MEVLTLIVSLVLVSSIIAMWVLGKNYMKNKPVKEPKPEVKVEKPEEPVAEPDEDLIYWAYCNGYNTDWH